MNLNQSKPCIPYTPIPDVHNTRLSLPVVTAERLQRETSKVSSAYCEGYASGQRFAVEAASFADLERFAADARSPFTVLPAWTRGFVDAVVELWQEMSGAPIGTAT